MYTVGAQLIDWKWESLADKAGVNKLQNCNLPTDKDAEFVKEFPTPKQSHSTFNSTMLPRNSS